MKAIVSWSGGKDCSLACYKAIRQGYQICTLLNFTTGTDGRTAFHGITSRLMENQAAAAGIPLYCQAAQTGDEYEKHFKAAVRMLKGKYGIESMIFGDIYLDEHKEWVERVCKDLQISAVEPLWALPAEQAAKEFIDNGFKAVVISAKSELFGEDFIGRDFDYALVAELKERKLCPCGENGEFHTFVYDGPLFKKPVPFTRTGKILKEGFWKHWFLELEAQPLQP